MDFGAMIIDMAISEFSDAMKPKKDSEDSDTNIQPPKPIEGFGELVTKAIGQSMHIDLNNDEMNMAHAIGNFFGK